jgi:hypothetical protein
MAIETKDALYDEIDKLVLKHGLCMEVGYEEGDIVPLEGRQFVSISVYGRIRHTATGFRRRIMKFSALIIMKRVNL